MEAGILGAFGVVPDETVAALFLGAGNTSDWVLIGGRGVDTNDPDAVVGVVSGKASVESRGSSLSWYECLDSTGEADKLWMARTGGKEGMALWLCPPPMDDRCPLPGLEE